MTAAASATKPLVEVRDAVRKCARHVAVRDVIFRLGAGRILAMAGPNGSGKTTLLVHLARFLASIEGAAARPRRLS